MTTNAESTTSSEEKPDTSDVTEVVEDEATDVTEAKPCQNVQPLSNQSNHSVENSKEASVSSNVPTTDISNAPANDVTSPASDVTAVNEAKEKPYLFSRRGSGRRLTASTMNSIVPLNQKNDSSSADKNVRIR